MEMNSNQLQQGALLNRAAEGRAPQRIQLLSTHFQKKENYVRLKDNLKTRRHGYQVVQE